MPVYVIERRFAEQLEMSTDEVNLLEDINADAGVSWSRNSGRLGDRSQPHHR
jgi:hypothetical protein